MKLILLLNYLFAISVAVVKSDDCLFVGCTCSTVQQTATCDGNGATQLPARNTTYPAANILTIVLKNYNLPSFSYPSFFNKLSFNDLQLINNNIQTLGNAAFDSTVIKNIFITEPKLTKIEAGFFTPIANTLRQLTITNSGLTSDVFNSFEAAFQPLWLLETLSLTVNGLTTIKPTTLAGLTGLRQIDLSKNSLNSNLGIFGTNTKLEAVNLDNNQISTLDELIRSLAAASKNLISLSLRNNQIVNLASLSSLSSLKEIYLSNNQIKTINDSFFNGLNGLNKVVLSNNVIEATSANWFLNSIKEPFSVDLSNNRLSSVPNLKQMEFLQTLNLANQNGQLKTIGPFAFERPSKTFMSVIMDVNPNISFDQNSFCSSSSDDYSLNRLVLSYSTAANFNKCFLKSIKVNMNYFIAASNMEYSLEINDQPADVSSVCNCNLIRFANAYGFSVKGACGAFNVSSSCASFNGVDDCSNFYNCGGGSQSDTTTTSTGTTTTVSTTITKSSTNSASDRTFNLNFILLCTLICVLYSKFNF